MNSATAVPASPTIPAAAAPATTPGFVPSAHHGEKVEKHFTPLVQQFLSYLKLEKHFSEYTVKSYGADLIQFGQFMSGEIGQAPANGAPVDGSVAPAASPKVSPEELDKRQLGCEP